ncbi:PWWP domain protein [Ancylostoma caninum]|uniref:PWWP domain protein n=2 Tax=Ancylostoma TaxID=29169 RepID=A0A368G2P1_ANCCA|nr:PWWP domain protein [Ancylostoma caninum]
MDTQSSSDSSLPKPGDLIWAKMKGFPPWPAKVLEKDKDTPLSRIPVIFFGTGEKAFMKPSDVCDYYENKAQHEVPRKHKGFNEAIHEIRVAAGFETPYDADPLFGASTSSKGPSPMLSGTTEEKLRSGAGKMLSDAFLSGFERRRANSASTRSRSRASSSASALKKLHKAMHRRRMDSGSSAGSRRVKGLAGFNDRGFDLFDNFQCYDGADYNVDDGLNLFGNDDVRSSRSKRSRASSKLYDDFLLNGFGTRSRHRSGSASEVGRRSRLISGVSDVFDELIFNGDLSIQQAAEQFLHTLEEIPSESSEGRPGTPEAPAPLPEPTVFCTACGCECKPHEGKLRCTSKFCRKFNDSPNFVENKVFSGALPSTSTAPTASTSRIDEKPESKPAIHSDGSAEALQKNKARTRSGLSLVKEEKVDSREHPSISESKPSLRAKRGRPSSPPKKKVKKEEPISSFDSTTAKEQKPEKVLTPPRELSLFSPAPSQKPATTSNATNNVAQKRPGRGTGRPKQYKVEKTPVMGANGQRQCTFCNGQVRPQMCGSNKHRWRCVDKKCRKWYGWVKSHEEIPRDLGRKGRWNRANRPKKVVITQKPKEEEDTGPASLSSQAEAALAAAEIQSMRSDGTDPLALIVERNVQQEVKKKLGRPPKEHGLKIRLKGGKEKKEDTRQKRKYVRRRDKLAAGALHCVSPPAIEHTPPKPAPQPLTEAEKSYEPCAIEKRVRWWLTEKRRVDTSPERPFETKAIDSCAAFRMLSHAFRAAAVTRADEAQSVNGSLDILMDSLMGSLGPLLTVASAAFENLIPDELSQMLWNSSSVHLPTFQ